MKNFPIKSIDKPINMVEFQIRSTYSPGLNFAEVPDSIVDSLKQAENTMDETRCLDALCVLRDYCNIVVYSRFDRGSKLEPKKLDDWNSSSKISSHLANGEDSCIT